MAHILDLESPLILNENNDQEPNDPVPNEEVQKSCTHKYICLLMTLFIISTFILQTVNSYKSAKHSNSPSGNLTDTAYIKYFAKIGENPMQCDGDYCMSWQIPRRVVCTIVNYHAPWDPDALWTCEAECPCGYELNTAVISCVRDKLVARNPHHGCYLAYSMGSIDGISGASAVVFILISLLFTILLSIICCPASD